MKFQKELTNEMGRAFQAAGTASAKVLGLEVLSVKLRGDTPGSFKP